MQRAQSRVPTLHPRRPVLGAAVAVLVLVLATACSSGSSGGGAATSPAAAASGGTTVEVKDFKFAPMILTVKAGTTVTWKFDDSTAHTVTADDNSFTSDSLANGQTYTHTFSTAGQVKYHCSIHPYMVAAIVVT